MQQLQSAWRCIDEDDHKAWNDNDCHWHEGRDHKKVLELPSNIEEIDKERRCDWLKKQYKKLAKKW